MRPRLLSRREVVAGSAGLLVAAASRTARADACTSEQLEQALREIAEARAKVTTLSGPFTQERKIGLLAAKVRSTGIVTLVRPDRLRWELAPPDDVVYWVLPEGLAYQGKNGQGRVENPGERAIAALDDLRAVLGGDLASLRARYDLRGTCNPDGSVVFEALLKGASGAGARKISFQLATDHVSPKSATIVEGARNTTEIVFGTMQKNAPVDPARMRPPR